MYKCEICEKEIETFIGLASHIGRCHKKEITIEEYYLKFIGEKGKCKECGKDTNFVNLNYGYCKFCSIKCSANNSDTRYKYKKTCMKNLGVENSMQSGEVKERYKKTCMKNLGVENSFQSFEVKEKSKETNMKNLGVKNASQCDKVKKKKRETCMKNLGVEYSMQSPVVREKSMNTCLKNFDVKNPSQNKEVINKIHESKLRNNNGVNPNKLTYKKLKERYPMLVEIEKLIEGPNGEILAHCKNSNCKNSKENGGYFEPTITQIGRRNQGINTHDTDNLYCCEECKHSCPLYGKSASALHNLLNENKEILYTSEEYSTWRTEVFQRQLLESPEHTINYCEYCHVIEDLHVHHIHPQKLEPGYALDPDNGIVVCEKCHYEKCHEKGTECSTGNLANKICK